MNKRKIYKNEKKGKEIRDSYDAVLKQWDCSIKELDIKGKYGTTHIIELGSEQNDVYCRTKGSFYDGRRRAGFAAFI